MDQAGIVANPQTYGQLADDDGNAGHFPPWTNDTGAMYFKFREPVMAEPLDYYSTEQEARP